MCGPVGSPSEGCSPVLVRTGLTDALYFFPKYLMTYRRSSLSQLPSCNECHILPLLFRIVFKMNKLTSLSSFLHHPCPLDNPCLPPCLPPSLGVPTAPAPVLHIYPPWHRSTVPTSSSASLTLSEEPLESVFLSPQMSQDTPQPRGSQPRCELFPTATDMPLLGSPLLPFLHQWPLFLVHCVLSRAGLRRCYHACMHLAALQCRS